MKNVSKPLGNFLIAFSVIGFLILLLPLIIVRFPTPHSSIDRQGYFISIPKIQAVSPIVVGVDPWNRAEYERALSKGIAQAEGTYLPGENKLIFLFAHSSGMPWEILGKNVPFLRLDEVQTGDELLLTNGGKEYIYIVSEKKVVEANETKYLQATGENELILQTCWPLGTDWKRLLVFAKPLHESF